MFEVIMAWAMTGLIFGLVAAVAAPGQVGMVGDAIASMIGACVGGFFFLAITALMPIGDAPQSPNAWSVLAALIGAALVFAAVRLSANAEVE